MTFKPKKQQIHVPGYGVVQKEDFTQEHFDILIKRAGNSKEKRDAFIDQYFKVASYGDQPLFEDKPEPVEVVKPKNKKGQGKKSDSVHDDEAELNRLIEEEEKSKEKDSE